MKTAKHILYNLPDIIGKQLSPKAHTKKMKQLDKDMQLAIAKHKIYKKRNHSSNKKSVA